MTAAGVFLLIAVPLLLYAAARDIATRLIPDEVSLAIVAAGIATRLFEGWQQAGMSLLVGVLLFVVLLLLAMRGMIGGGDAKLIAAMATGLPPAETWNFIVATVLAGGVLAVGYLVARRLMPQPRLAPGAPMLRRLLAVEAWRIRRRGPLPYAVAIAAGGLFLLLSLPRA
jgi:prepilin peptidase CpaA